MKWLSEQRVRGRVAARVGRRGDDLIAEFPNVGTVVAGPRGERFYVEAVVGSNPVLLEKLNQSLVAALVRHAQRKVTLHGAAVGIGSKAIALIGPSRAGKSTLAGTLCAGGECDLVSDDTVAVEINETDENNKAAEILPTQTKLWLLPDACQALGFDAPILEGKNGVAVPATSRSELCLMAIVGLRVDRDATEPRLRRLRGHEAFSCLCSSTIRLVVDDPEAQRHEFDQLRGLVNSCLIMELRRPSDLGKLRLSADLVRPLLESGSTEGL
jgi:hypothetical protein